MIDKLEFGKISKSKLIDELGSREIETSVFNFGAERVVMSYEVRKRINSGDQTLEIAKVISEVLDGQPKKDIIVRIESNRELERAGKCDIVTCYTLI